MDGLEPKRVAGDETAMNHVGTVQSRRATGKDILLVALSIAAAALVRLCLVPVLGTHTPYITFFLAIVFSAWVAGFGGGVAATLLSLILTLWMFPRADGQHGAPRSSDLTGMILFIVEGVAISALGQMQIGAQRRAQQSAAAASASAARAEEAASALTESVARKSAILEVALDCIITIDEQTEILEFNPAAEATFRYKRADVIGRTIAETIIPPSLRQAHWAGVERFLKTGKSTLLGKRIEITAMRADGSEFPVEIAIVSNRAEGRQEFTAYLRDISARKRAEDELRQATARQRAFLRDVLFSVTEGHLILCDTEDQLPPKYAPASGDIVLTPEGGLSELRHASELAAQRVEMERPRIYDLVTAVSEAAMNAAVHVGAGDGQVFVDVDKGIVQVRVTDQGGGIALENIPHATLQKGYTTAGTLGHGMKLMLATADRVYLLTGASGTVVAIEQDRFEPRLDWTQAAALAA